MYEIRIYNDVLFYNEDYYSGDEDIKTFTLYITKRELLDGLQDMLKKYEGETYSAWKHNPDGTKDLLIGGALDPNDPYDLADELGIEFKPNNEKEEITMTATLDIYFSDLKPGTQQDLLDLVGARDAKDMNWDVDVVPLFTYEVEVEIEN